MRNLPILLMLLMAGNLFAANWTDDGHGGVYWSMNNYTISAYPKTSTMTGNSFYQYVNFTSTNPNPITANLSFVFNEAPSTGSISIFRNITTRLNATYTVIGVTSFVVSTATCSIGDNLNLYKYNVTYGANATTGIACFDSYTQNGNDYTLKYSYSNYIGWENILSQFHYTQVANKHVWTYNNVPFNGSTKYQTKFEYSFPLAISTSNGATTQKQYNGKFDIYAHTGSPSDVVNGIGTTYVVLDPFYTSTGGAVTTDGLYTVVTFLANGTFNVTGTINNATVLVVAGGGGSATGGGGAGGYNYSTGLSLNGNYAVTVGNGGLGGNGYVGHDGGIIPQNGSNSSFGTLITSIGGGAGGYMFQAGGEVHYNGFDGGSGGGGSIASDAQSYGGTGTLGQGNNGGGNGNNQGAPYPAGGGGGAGSQGFNATTNNIAGNGGTGLNNSINGINQNYSCGGGGSTYSEASATAGLGGCSSGGNGNIIGDGGNGTDGTGSGGGGASHSEGYPIHLLGGKGGSGIVIIRYLTYVEPPVANTNITCNVQTETKQYNGTSMNYTITGIFTNPTQEAQTVNISIVAGGTVVATANNMQINSSIYTLSGNYTVARGSLDANFTINASATGSNQAVLNRSSSVAILMILPIDPPSAINLMANGGKTRCRTPQDVGYWDNRNWNINASWNCNYTGLSLTNNISFVDSGTTTFSNSDITASTFQRLAGDLGTMANFIFQAISTLRIH
jgi:hypothetical protein